MLIETQSQFAEFVATDRVNSDQGETASSNTHRELPKQSELAMYLEMGIALTAAFGLLAMGAWIWLSANPDWRLSIHRLQDML
jgi:hypothetical protein